jgi:NADH-quinone oxidoreductase subunit M
MDFALLPSLVALPLLGAVLCALAGSRGQGARMTALVISVLHFAVAMYACYRFNWNVRLEQLMAEFGSFAILNFSLKLGADSLSLLLVVTTSVLSAVSILASFSRPTGPASRDGAFYGWLMVLLGVMSGVWLARDLLLFYAFFELILVPLFFLIGTFGGADRRLAAGKIFLYTFTGSILALPAILYLGLQAGTFDLGRVIHWAQTPGNLSATERMWVLLGLLASFGVKTPLFPLHTWQPTAMGESPGSGVVDASGLVLKLGAYAMLKIAIPIGFLSTDGLASPTALTVVSVLAVVGILYGALCAWAQTDAKRLLAYSSLSHVGFVVLGIVALTDIGLRGASLYLINTAIITGGLFLIVGMIYERYGTRSVVELSGLGKVMPIGAFFLGLFTMAAIGLPLLSGFVSEFLTILAAFTSPYLGLAFGVCAALGIVLGAIYMLTMAARLLFGPLKVPAPPAGAVMKGDLNLREVMSLAPLAVLIVVLGVYPQPVLNTLKFTTDPILQPVVGRKAPVPAAEGEATSSATGQREPSASLTGGEGTR